ncbi:MAG: hypothetical protein ACRDHZ_20565, partial [Ktedonobacteraceae bacterium]
MPKPARHTLVWSLEDNTYAVYEKGQRHTSSLLEDNEAWLAWLADHRAFSFQGRHGHLNLLKETRARGNEGYWYAYRRQGQRRIKQYAGRTSDVTIARLEELARGLALPVLVDENAQATRTKREVFQSAQQEYIIDAAPQPLLREYTAHQMQLERVVYKAS